MKTLKSYINHIFEGSTEVKNAKLKRLLAKEGLDKIILCKDYGYFYITSDDDEWAEKIAGMYENAIYINSFNQQSPEEWVEDIKRLLKHNNILESLLDDVENTIASGNTAVKAAIDMDFEKLRSMVIDKSRWKLHTQKGYDFHRQYAYNHVECANLMLEIGYEKLNCLQITIDRDVMKKIWSVRFYCFNNRFSSKVSDKIRTETQFPESSRITGIRDVLKFIDSKTKDIDTLKKFLEENKL